MIIYREYHGLQKGMVVASYGGRLCMCDWICNPRSVLVIKRLEHHLGAGMQPGTTPVIEGAIRQLDEYAEGVRTEFSVSLLVTGTEFQKRVLEALRDVRYGETETYGALARRIGNPRGVRAVAMALALNPLSIILPCHRIVGADKSLTGYAGGIDMKRFLLEHEQSVVQKQKCGQNSGTCRW